ncbi:erythrocyte membrane protein 1, PfEMP1, putative, partial [Plasmodium reichenowi]
MGSQSSKSPQRSDVTNESHKSARNVLENIGKIIKAKASQDTRKYSNALKGDLKKAKFYHPFSEYRPYYTGPCELEYEYHSNIWNGIKEYRHPCAGRNKNRFSNESEAECNSSKITDNKTDHGACAPYRRRHLCDYILQQVSPNHINNSHDLLGNLLVTAKYEGKSIVNSYANSGTLNVCTGLARSFADIGDIIRGKDLYIGNGDYKEKVSNNLKTIFKKIYEELKKNYRETETLYKDEEGNYLKLREAWWNANRDQIWKAITCFAPQNAQYFIQLESNKQLFSNPKCGHSQGNVPTYLDYVPQFLRWFNEWSEDFCRVREHKLKKVKEVCRGEYDGGLKRYCSGDGYDCTKTDLSRNSIYVDLDCPDCEKKCRKYNEWIENQENEFNKQRKKYEKEIVKTANKDDNKYVQDFYKNLKTRYTSTKFLETLKEVPQCSNHTSDSKIDFNKSHEIFTTTKYCETCPPFGVTCNRKGKCEPNKGNESDSKDTKGQSTSIEVLVTHIRGTDIVEDLKDCKKHGLFKGIRNQKWKCEYKNQIDECKVDKFVKHIDVDERISFKVLFERWLRNFIKDYNKYKNPVERCIHNKHANENLCIKGCKNKCECLEKWIKIKEVEWEKINQHYNQQKEHYTYSVPYWVNSFLTQKYFSSDFINVLESAKNINGLENLKQCGDGTCKIEIINKMNEDLIKELISKLKDKIATCKSKNDDNNGTKCCVALPKSADDEDDEDDKDQEKTSSTPCGTDESSSTNPCGDKSAAKLSKTLTVVATEIQEEAHKKMVENSGTDGTGESKLKGDISRGIFYNRRKVNYLKAKQICDITIQDSNAQRNNRAYKYEGPCGGKNDQRFNIGTEWSIKDNKRKTTHPEVYMPPRREHMCTSNLENLDTSSDGLKGDKAMHSLLGDVLIAAKYEAENIKKRYQQNEGKKGLNDKKDQETVCRAIRYSFGDLGDIIRGKDLWDQNGDAKRLQENLKKIFENIKKKHADIKNKYTSDNDKHTKLRSDWWEANRDQVWEAMKCAIKNDNFPCKSDHIPLDDYIPQRLRWMTEWAEWYCKEQARLYGELEKECAKCSSGLCKNGCDDCKKKCENYRTFIEKWKKQWDKIKQKYGELYKEADRPDTGTSGQKSTRLSKEDQRVVDFLKQLKEGNKSSGNTTYSTAEGYVHQELPNMECKEQTQFCNTSGIDKKNYAFEDYPKNYKERCICTNGQDQNPAETIQKKACEIVKELLDGKNGKSKIEGCDPKADDQYPDWDCKKNYSNEENKGICVPPRRRKLCTSDLTKQDRLKTKDDIKREFINSAAIENYFAWERYKTVNKETNSQLQKGTIPDDFLRSMKYTFSDYRDIFFGKDISTYYYISDVSKK